MTKSYTQVTADINRGIAKMREGAPDATHAFDEFQAEAAAHTATSTA